jgi:hypothetical protein
MIRPICLLLAALAVFSNAMNPMKPEFISGFETGIFIRDSPDMLKQYNCKKVAKKEMSPELAKIESLIEPMKLVGKMSKDKVVKTSIQIVEIFVRDIENLLAVFDDSYKGGDYCSGIIFGMSGADLLINISKKAIELGRDFSRKSEL